VSVILSAAMAYVIGRAFIADRESFLRTKIGIWTLVLGATSLLFLPPQVAALVSTPLPDGLSSLGLNDLLKASSSFSPWLLYAAWIVTSVAALLIGAEVWRAGEPGWRPGSGGNAMDSSAVGRASGLLVMSDSLEDVADVISRVNLDAKGVEKLSGDLEEVGRRLAFKMPEEPAGVYKFLVENGVPIAIAAPATGHLSDGAKKVRC
jgi:hypothetical protein